MERSEYGKIKRFNTAYLVEAKKLRQEPTVLPDNALVEMYLETLESGFAQEVRVNMTQMKLLATRLPGLTTPTPAPAAPKVKRRGEIPLEDVLKTAETIAEHFGGTGLQVNLSTGPVQPVSVLPPAADKTTVKREVAAHLEEFQSEIATLKDQSVNQEKRFKETLAKMEANLKQSFSQSTRDPPPHKDIVQTGEASNRWGQDRAYSQRPEQSNVNLGPCWYCGQGHRMANCHFKQEHIDMGYITFDGGLVRFGNGGPIPRYPDSKTKKEKVDEHYSSLGKPRGTSLFQAQASVHDQFSQFHASDDRVDYDSRDDELRSLRVQMNLQRTQVVPHIQMNPVRHPQVQQNYQGNSAQQFMQLPAPVGGITGGFDALQLVQLVDEARKSAAPVQQLVTTWTGARTDTAPNPNF
jgi:hypothetical protein